MKRQTRKVLLNIFTGVALAATAAVVFTPALAFAAPPNLGISVGPGGVQVGIGDVDEDEDQAEVCFFERSRYRGDSFCMESGETMRDLRRNGFNDEISSFTNDDGLRVQVCADSNFRDCRTYTSGSRSLGDYDDEISSIRVR